MGLEAEVGLLLYISSICLVSVRFMPLRFPGNPWGEKAVDTERHAIISIVEPCFEESCKLNEEPKLVHKL